MSQFFPSGVQSIGISTSVSVLPVNIQDWFPLGWTGWISLQSKELSRVFSNTTVQKHQLFGTQLSFLFYFIIFKLYNIVLVLPYINMNPPQVYTCSPPWTLLPPRTIPLGRPSSHPYMTIGKTIALTRRTIVGKVMSLLFNMLSRLVIAFLPRSKCLLISWLQSPSAVILEPPKMKSVTPHLFAMKWWNQMSWS